MGYIKHECVITVLYDRDVPEVAEVEELRQAMAAASESLHPRGSGLENWLLGPARGINGYTTYVFAPDGSKEGWEDSDIADEFRARFLEIVKRSKWADVVHLQLGGDDRETRVLFSTDDHAAREGT